MAYSGAALSATEQALRAANKPLVIGRNWLRGVTTAPQWRTSGSWASGSNGTDADGPTPYLYDGFDHDRSLAASAETAWYLLLDLGAAAPGVVDSIALLRPLGLSGVQIQVQIADNNAYSTNLITVATTTPADNQRVVLLDLHHTGSVPMRYSDVRWMRLALTKGSAFTPRIGELIVGRCRQLKHAPNLPWDPLALRGDAVRTETYGGVIVQNVRHKGRRHIAAPFNPHESAYQNDFVSLFEEDTDFGTRPFLWVDQPTAAPEAAYWMLLDEPALAGPYVGWTERDFRLVASEQGPNFRRPEALGI